MAIAPEVLSRVPETAQRFAAARPFRHVAIDGFLEPDLCARLLAEFPAFEERNAINEMGEVGQKAVREDVGEISPAFRELDAHIRSPAFLDYVSRVTGIPDLLYDPDYIGGGTHENRHGQSLDAHVDFNYHPGTRWHRRLNLIIYLNPRWEREWGGHLELRADPWSAAGPADVEISPDFNRCVIFETTESSWHGFSGIRLPENVRHLSRKSFAIYLYTREREAAETAPPHATVYVPDGMPADWQAGRVLSGDDLALLRQRFVRMQSQLRFLYEREKEFAAQLGRVEAALAEARDALRLPLQGHAEQPGPPSGICADLWMGPEAAFPLRPTRACRRLRIALWAPPQIANGQRISLEVGGARTEVDIRPGAIGTLDLPVRLREGQTVEVRLQSAGRFTPAAEGQGGDERSLSCRLVSLVLD